MCRPRILGELRDRCVAPVRLGGERLEDDVVEVADERTAAVGRRHVAGRSGDGLEHRAERLEAAGADATHRRSGDELVQDRAERVDVGGGRDRLAAHLLGAGVLGREQVRPGAGGRVGGALIGEQLGDAEVQQLGRALLGHQDVRWLEVAVHESASGARAAPRRTPGEELDAGAHREVALVGEARDGPPLHQLHDEVRQAVVGGAAVEEAHNPGVLEGRQDLALGPEADDRLGESPARGRAA